MTSVSRLETDGKNRIDENMPSHEELKDDEWDKLSVASQTSAGVGPPSEFEFESEGGGNSGVSIAVEHGEGLCRLHRCKPYFNLRFLSQDPEQAVVAPEHELLHDALDSDENGVMKSPKLSESDSKRILEEMKKCRLMMDFCEFQKFVLLSYAVERGLLLEQQEDHDEEFCNGAKSSLSQGGCSMMACSTDPQLLELFKRELWVPDLLEEIVDDGDPDQLSEKLFECDCTLGVYLINATKYDFIQTREIDGASSSDCGYFIGKKCDSWRLIEERFGENAFCILVADNTFKDFLEARHRLPSHCMPTYDKGHVVLWSRLDKSPTAKHRHPGEALPGIVHVPEHSAPRPKWSLVEKVESNLPYNWPEDVSCSYRQWKRIIFSSQLQELIKISEERAKRNLLTMHRRHTLDDGDFTAVAHPTAHSKLKSYKSAPAALHHLIFDSADRFHDDVDKTLISDIHKHLDNTCILM